MQKPRVSQPTRPYAPCLGRSLAAVPRLTVARLTAAGLTVFMLTAFMLCMQGPLLAQPSELTEALDRADALVELEASVRSEIVIPQGVELTAGWVEVTSLVSEAPPLAFKIADRKADDDEVRWAPKLPNGPAMVCTAADGFAVYCVEMYLFRGVQGDYLGPLELQLEWFRGLAVRGTFLSQSQPLEGAQVALVPAEMQSRRSFTMPLGTSDAPSRQRLAREILTDADGVFLLPPIAEGTYFLETLLPSGRFHRSDEFSLPNSADGRRQIAAEDADLVTFELGEIEVLEGLSMEVRTQATTGEWIRGAQITARQGTTADDLISFQALTNASGRAHLAGFRVEDPVQVSCSKAGFITFRKRYSTVPALILCDLETMARISGSVVASDGSNLAKAWVSLVLLEAAKADEPGDDAPVTPSLAPKASSRPPYPNIFENRAIETADAPPPKPIASQPVDSDGGFAIPDLAAGRYRLSATAPQHEVLVQEIDVGAGEDRLLSTLRLMAGREVVLQIVDAASGRPLPNVWVESIDPPGAVDGITDAKGELTFATRSDAGLLLGLRAENYADAQRRFTAEQLRRQGQPLEPGPLRIELQRPGWVRIVVYDQSDGSGDQGRPCQGCPLVITPPGHELRTDEVGQVLSPPLEPGTYRIYRPSIAHLGSTVVEQPDAVRRYAKVKAGTTSLVQFGKARSGVQVTFDPDLPPGWGLRAQTRFHAERLQLQPDGSFHVRHRDGEALDLFLLFYDPRLDRTSEIRLATLPADLDVSRLKLRLRSSSVRGRLKDFAGHPLVVQPVHLVTLDRATYAKVWTDANGEFYIPYAPEGAFGLHIGQRNMRFISVSPGQDLDVGEVQLELGRF